MKLLGQEGLVGILPLPQVHFTSTWTVCSQALAISWLCNYPLGRQCPLWWEYLNLAQKSGLEITYNDWFPLITIIRCFWEGFGQNLLTHLIQKKKKLFIWSFWNSVLSWWCFFWWRNTHFVDIILFKLTDVVCQSGPGPLPSLVYAQSALYPMGNSAAQVCLLYILLNIFLSVDGKI